MPGENYWAWSTVAANNGTADSSIDWHEGQARASVNNSSRSELAAHAKNRNLLNGSITTAGAANVQTFLSGMSFVPGTDTIPAGMAVKLKIGAGLTNTGSATLNMDGLGDVTIKTADGNNLLGGELIANSYVDLLYNGTNWIFLFSREFFQNEIVGGSGIILSQQVFSTAGVFTYTPTTGMACCIIECIGGGGAGGGTGLTTVQFLSAGGGGSGGYSRKLATAADIGPSQTVTIGAGGLSVAGGSGNAGGQSSVGTLCIANGGGGAPWYQGGVGASPGTGDINAAGASGTGGFLNNDATITNVVFWGGAGGSGPFGGGGLQGQANSGDAQNGNPGRNYGSGGGGANVYAVGGSPRAGGNGSPGVVIISEFAGRGAPGPAGPVGPQGPAGSGSGNVLSVGTPVAGQYAVWTSSSQIQGVPPPFNFLGGLTLSNDGTTPLTVLDIATGSATSDDNTMMMTLASAITKNCNAAWAVGSGNGALDAGVSLAASTWYHVFLIERTDTGVVDALISPSATAPAMPTSYTKKRRIGSTKTNASSQIIAFSQQGDEFLWRTAVTESFTVPLSLSLSAPLVGTPTGYKPRAHLSGTITAASATSVTIVSPDVTGATVGNPGNLVAPGPPAPGPSNLYGGYDIFVRTDTSGRVLSGANGPVTISVFNHGWIDDRGK